MLLETQSGARIDVEVQVADAYGYDIQCQVVCEKGTVNLPDPYAVVKRSNATRSFPILTDWKDRFIEAYDIELTHWVKTLEEKGEPDGPSAWTATLPASQQIRSTVPAARISSCRSR